MKKIIIFTICLAIFVFPVFASWFDDAFNATKDTVTNAANDTAKWTTNAANDTAKWTVNAANDTANWTVNAANDTANWAVKTYDDVASYIKVHTTSDKIQTPKWLRGTWYNLDRIQSLYVTENDILFDGSALKGSLDDLIQDIEKTMTKPKVSNSSKNNRYVLSVADKKSDAKEEIANISKDSDTAITVAVPLKSFNMMFTKGK